MSGQWTTAGYAEKKQHPGDDEPGLDLPEHGLHPAPPHAGQTHVHPPSEEKNNLRKIQHLHPIKINPKICYLWRPNFKCSGKIIKS